MPVQPNHLDSIIVFNMTGRRYPRIVSSHLGVLLCFDFEKGVITALHCCK